MYIALSQATNLQSAEVWHMLMRDHTDSCAYYLQVGDKLVVLGKNARTARELTMTTSHSLPAAAASPPPPQSSVKLPSSLQSLSMEDADDRVVAAAAAGRTSSQTHTAGVLLCLLSH